MMIAAAALLLAGLRSGAQVYVATDKQAYIAGDMVWCSAFCADSNAVAYLELRSTEAVGQTSRIALDRGRGAGGFQIPLTVPSGNYKLVAYTDCAKLADGYDFYAGSRTISIYNTLSGERVKDGVELTDGAPMRPLSSSSAGISVEVADSVTIRNTSGSKISFSLSMYRQDSLEPSSYSSIATADLRPLGVAQRERTGEIVRGRLAGKDASALSGDIGLTAFISVPGDKYCVYTSYISPEGTVEFHTDNIYRDRDLVCQIDGLESGADCHFSPDSPFVAPAPASVDPLPLSRKMDADLVRRTRAMQAEQQGIADTLYESLPMHRDHILLADECKTYVLDDYVRFPTMKELFVEIIPEMHVRGKAGRQRVSVLVHDPKNTRVAPRWGNSLMMIDGVPVFDHELFMNYDPALVKAVEVYPSVYSFGDRSYEGVANFVTFKGNMPSIAFDDNVRIFDFRGAAVPMSYRGRETVIWEPLLELEAGQTLRFDRSSLEDGVQYNIVVEGLTETGRTVYARKNIR